MSPYTRPDLGGPKWMLKLCFLPLIVGFAWLPVSDAQQAWDVQSTKEAYLKLAEFHALGLREAQTNLPLHVNLEEARAARKEVIFEIQSRQNLDPELTLIAHDLEEASGKMFESFDALKRMPTPPGFLQDCFDHLYMGIMLQLERLEQVDKSKFERTEAAQAVIRQMMEASRNERIAVLLLPRIAQKLAGPDWRKPENIQVEAAEPWGFIGRADHLMLRNNTARTLHNCTVVVSLQGKKGDTQKNVHFTKTWPNETFVEAFYVPGEEIVGELVGRTTVNRIQYIDVAIYSDELRLEKIHYQYFGQNRDLMIGYYLDKKFTATSAYRPFSKGLVWDDQRRIAIGFRGLDFLPSGRLTLTLKNGTKNVTRTSKFSPWRAGEDKYFEFKDISWDPTEWSVRFQFDDTDVTRTYTWKRQNN